MCLELLIFPKPLRPYSLLPRGENTIGIQSVFDSLHKPSISVVVEVIQTRYQI